MHARIDDHGDLWVLAGRHGGVLVEDVKDTIEFSQRIYSHAFPNALLWNRLECAIGGHAEVGVSAAKHLKEVGILPGTRCGDSAIVEHDFVGSNILCGPAILTRQKQYAI